jgi:hypothetical protein
MGRGALVVREFDSDLLNAYETASYINRSVRYVRDHLRYNIPVQQAKSRGPLYFHKRDLDRWILETTDLPT